MKTKNIILISSSILLNLILGIYIVHLHSRYDLFVDKEQKRQIDNFVEIATGSEFGVSQNIRKWEQPVKIWIKADSVYTEQREFLDQKIEELNQIQPDYLKIEIVQDSSECNSKLTFCSFENIGKTSPEIEDQIKSNFAGWTYFNYNQYKIFKSQIFIKTTESMDMQKNAILEELVQSLGLAQDILNDKESLFYENKNKEGLIYHTLNDKDRKIVEMLYHPKIKPGFDRYEIENVLTKILN